VASDFAFRASARQGPTSLFELRRDKKTSICSGAWAQGSPINRDLRFATTGRQAGFRDQGAETEEKRKEEREGTRDQTSEVGDQKQKKRGKRKESRAPVKFAPLVFFEEFNRASRDRTRD
jgi:hypothetical protein